MKVWLSLLIGAVAAVLSTVPVWTSERSESIPSKEPLTGYVVCSDRNEQFVSTFLDGCRKLPGGRINCGQAVGVFQRRGEWLQIALPDGIPRYLPASVVSRSADKFVPFDAESGVADQGSIQCPVTPVAGFIAPRPIFTPDPPYQQPVSGEVFLAVDVLTKWDN